MLLMLVMAIIIATVLEAAQECCVYIDKYFHYTL